MTITERYTPASLRDIVERGANPIDYLAPGEDVGTILDDLMQATRVAPDGRAGEAKRLRERLDWMLAERHTGLPLGDGRDGSEESDPDAFARITRALQWHFDLACDPGLIDRVIPLLPYRDAWKAMEQVDKARSPHPLRLVLAERWSTCDGCGSAIPPGGRMMQLGVQRDYSEDPNLEALAWCVDCLRHVAGLLEVGKVEG